MVIFDLDGTLVDSAPDIAKSVDYALRSADLETPGISCIKQYIGEGAARLIHRAITHEMDGEADRAAFESVSSAFFEYYRENVCVLSRPYDGVKDALERLLVMNHALACVTNKPIRFAEPLLEQLGMLTYFSSVIGGDSLTTKKPAAEPLLQAAEDCAVDPHRCIMVGDTTIDVQAAHAANMRSVFVTYGYGKLIDNEERAPDAIIDDIEQFFDFLAVDTSQ